MKPGETVHALPLESIEAINAALAAESDRAQIIILSAWIDESLKVKLLNEFGKGNSKARRALFSNNGPFATFSAKVNVAYCAGWIAADMYHDIQVLRKLRNEFAHRYNPVSLNDEKYRTLLESLQVPHREYFDWGQLRAASLDDGVAIYAGERPAEARDDLDIPGTLTFRMALPVVLAVLAYDLRIPFTTEEEGTLAIINIPSHMKDLQPREDDDTRDQKPPERKK